jgi:hypothetical protein
MLWQGILEGKRKRAQQNKSMQESELLGRDERNGNREQQRPKMLRHA